MMNGLEYIAYKTEHIAYQTLHVTYEFAHNINGIEHMIYLIAHIVDGFGHGLNIFGCKMNEYRHMTYNIHFAHGIILQMALYTIELTAGLTPCTRIILLRKFLK